MNTRKYTNDQRRERHNQSAREYNERKKKERRANNFKALLADVIVYEQQGMTYKEIAEQLSNDTRYNLTIKEN